MTYTVLTKSYSIIFLSLIKDDILQIMNKLDLNKAHGCDKISIRMLKDVEIQFVEYLA